MNMSKRWQAEAKQGTSHADDEPGQIVPHPAVASTSFDAALEAFLSTVLQSLLGHEQLEMINTYVRLAEQDTRDLYTRYSPVDALDMHHSANDRRQRSRDWRNSRKKASKRKR